MGDGLDGADDEEGRGMDIGAVVVSKAHIFGAPKKRNSLGQYEKS